MDKKQYLLTIRVPIEGMDDLDAREQAQKIIYDYSISDINCTIQWRNDEFVKLQEISGNKQPRKLAL